MAGVEGAGSPDSSEDSGGIAQRGGPAGAVREQDRFLPIANVSRIMKKALPANAKISKDAKETVQECVSEFISFVTGEASDKCQREKRKTINGDDLLWAMSTLGFEDYVEPLKLYLHKFREVEGERANNLANNNNNNNNINNSNNIIINSQTNTININNPPHLDPRSHAPPSSYFHKDSLPPPNGANPPPNGLVSTGIPLHAPPNMPLYHHHPPHPPMVMQYHVQPSAPSSDPQPRSEL